MKKGSIVEHRYTGFTGKILKITVGPDERLLENQYIALVEWDDPKLLGITHSKVDVERLLEVDMIDRPLPEHLDIMPLSYERDFGFEITRLRFMEQVAIEIQFWIEKRQFRARVVQDPFRGPDGCFTLWKPNQNKPLPREDVYKIRAIIARHIGLEPAAFQSFLDEYDPQFLKKYRYSFSTRCKHGGLSCIRPSHLIPTTYDGRPLR
jgi:hypothetical protein